MYEVICVPKKPQFLPTLPVFIESMFWAIYGPICKCANFFWKSLNASNVKLLPKNIFQRSLRFLRFFCFDIWFKVKINILDCLLLFIIWKRSLKVKIILNSLRNKKSWLIEPQMACNIVSITIGWVGKNGDPNQSRITFHILQ